MPVPGTTDLGVDGDVNVSLGLPIATAADDPVFRYMSPTPVVNVVRYSALIAGIGYGIIHGQKLQAKYDDRVEKQAIKHREDQIKKAKEEYAKIRAAKLAPPTPNGMLKYLMYDANHFFPYAAVVSNPEDPNFDLEKLLKYWEEKL